MQEAFSHSEEAAAHGRDLLAQDIELRVAFAGHKRPSDLGDADAVSKSLDAVFQLIAAAGVRRALLLSGLAPGSDRLAAAAWRRAGLGPVHAVEPFLPQGEPDPIYRQLADEVTFLDGEAARRRHRNPYLAQTRWLLNRADLLVVVWNGAAPRGPGGTADAVRIALEAGIPILWSRPGAETIRLLAGLQPSRDDFDEFLEYVAESDSEAEPADPARLAEVLELGAAEAAVLDVTPAAASLPDRWLYQTLWRTFAVFQRLVGGVASSDVSQPDPPPDLAAQAGFRTLTEAYQDADRRAVRLAAVHRSEQILLLAFAVIAAAICSGGAIFSNFHPRAVVVELMLAAIALLVWLSAKRAKRNERWAQARRLAEQIRLERTGWALGFSPCNLGSPSMRGEHRAMVSPLLRRTPAPVGMLADARQARWGEWALAELVTRQIVYHRGSMRLNTRIASRLRLVENVAFGALLLVLLGFVACAALHIGDPMLRLISRLALIAGVVVPAIGSASMALDAKLEFADRAERSARLARGLSDLAPYVDCGSGHDVEAAARQAFEWLIAEADQWREGASRRQLYRGG